MRGPYCVICIKIYIYTTVSQKYICNLKLFKKSYTDTQERTIISIIYILNINIFAPPEITFTNLTSLTSPEIRMQSRSSYNWKSNHMLCYLFSKQLFNTHRYSPEKQIYIHFSHFDNKTPSHHTFTLIHYANQSNNAIIAQCFRKTILIFFQ